MSFQFIFLVGSFPPTILQVSISGPELGPMSLVTTYMAVLVMKIAF